MARSALTLFGFSGVAALALVAGAWGLRLQRPADNSVTVKLPPPRPAAPGFTFGGHRQPAPTVELR